MAGALEHAGRSATVYHLTVAGLHNYHVVTNTGAPVLVHNNGCEDTGGQLNDAMYASRREAFRAAKRDAGIPMSEQPARVQRDEKLDDLFGRTILGRDHLPIYPRQYHFTGPGHDPVVILDHGAGHQYGAPGGVGDRGPHFNVREPGERHKSFHGTRPHYMWEE